MDEPTEKNPEYSLNMFDGIPKVRMFVPSGIEIDDNTIGRLRGYKNKRLNVVIHYSFEFPRTPDVAYEANETKEFNLVDVTRRALIGRDPGYATKKRIGFDNELIGTARRPDSYQDASIIGVAEIVSIRDIEGRVLYFSRD